MPEVQRVVLLVLDSFDDLIVTAGIDEGWMPTIGKLLSGGSCVRIEDDQASVPGSMWATALTGTPYHEHLIVYADQLKPGTYEIGSAAPEAARRPSFWRYLSAAGVASTVLGLPAKIEQGHLGTQVAAWGSSTQYAVNQGVRASPPDALAWLEAEVGPRRVAVEGSLRSPTDLRKNLDRALEEVTRQAVGIQLLMERSDWRFFASAFTQAHQIGHILWHLFDPSHPDHDPDADPDLRNCIRRVYARIDAVVGEIVAQLPEDTLVLLMSQEGMGPNVVRDDPIEGLLEAGAWLHRTAGIPGGPGGARAWALRGGRTLARRILPAAVRDQIGRRIPADRWWREIKLTGLDWSQTTAFAIPADVSSFVRVNLAGREPEGIVAPGDDYVGILHDLERDLVRIVDDETGLPVVDQVIEVERSIGRPVNDALPDLIVAWHRRPPFRRLRSPRFGVVELKPRDARTGQHRPTGWMLANGPGIPAMGGHSLDGPGHRMIDLAPTVMSALGVVAPDELPGHAIRWDQD